MTPNADAAVVVRGGGCKIYSAHAGRKARRRFKITTRVVKHGKLGVREKEMRFHPNEVLKIFHSRRRSAVSPFSRLSLSPFLHNIARAITRAKTTAASFESTHHSVEVRSLSLKLHTLNLDLPSSSIRSTRMREQRHYSVLEIEIPQEKGMNYDESYRVLGIFPLIDISRF